MSFLLLFLICFFLVLFLLFFYASSLRSSALLFLLHVHVLLFPLLLHFLHLSPISSSSSSSVLPRHLTIIRMHACMRLALRHPVLSLQCLSSLLPSLLFQASSSFNSSSSCLPPSSPFPPPACFSSFYSFLHHKHVMRRLLDERASTLVNISRPIRSSFSQEPCIVHLIYNLHRETFN